MRWLSSARLIDARRTAEKTRATLEPNTRKRLVCILDSFLARKLRPSTHEAREELRGSKHDGRLSLPGMEGAQAHDVVGQVPGLLRADGLGEGGHRRPVETGHENAVDIRARFAGLDVALREVIGSDGVSPAVLELLGRRAVTLAALAVALGAFELLVHRAASLDGVPGVRGLRRDGDGRSGLFLLPTVREGLDVGDHVEAVAAANGIPRGHVRPV